MADELTYQMSLTYDDSDGQRDYFITGLNQFSIPSFLFCRYKMTVLTADTPIPLGPITTLGFCGFQNRDTTSAITIYIKDQAGGSRFLELPPTILGSNPGLSSANGAWAWLNMGPDVTAPVAIATAPVIMECWLFNAT